MDDLVMARQRFMSSNEQDSLSALRDSKLISAQQEMSHLVAYLVELRDD
jgi:hypothetical protein